MQERVLLIEDDQEICELLTTILEREAFHVESAQDGITGDSLARTGRFDLIILDVMLPLRDGLTILRELRPEITTPVIMLTAKGEDIDRIVGLELGADDYLPKPFNPRELVARMKAILRRSESKELSRAASEDIIVHNLIIRPARREVFVNGLAVTLTTTEFDILVYLIEHQGEICTKATLYEGVLGRKITTHDRALDMHVSNLRKKIQDQWIKTIRGTGYLYQPPVEACEV